MSSLPGITRQDEEKRLQHTLEIAQRKVDANRQSVQALAEELHAMQEEFDENDKEAQTLFHHADGCHTFFDPLTDRHCQNPCGTMRMPASSS